VSGLLPGLLLGLALGANLVAWRATRQARLGLRREYLLVLVLAAYDRARVANGHGPRLIQQAVDAWLGEVDRQFGQGVHFWQRIPPVDEPWRSMTR
jgi:hypothetical protein